LNTIGRRVLKTSFNKDHSNEKYLQKIAVLNKFVLEIVEAKTFEELAKHVFEAITATIDPATENVGQVRYGAIWGFSYDRAFGKDIDLLANGAGMPLDGPGIMVKAVNTGKVINLPDTSKDPSYVDADLYDPYDYKRMYSEIAVPILVEGKAIGVINVEEFEANAFDESDQRILEALSAYAGVSLSNISYSNRVDGLHKYTSQLGKLTSIGEIAELTVDAMTDSLELESCAFLLKQENGFQTIYEKGLEESIRRRETALKYFRSYTLPVFWRESDDITFLSEVQIPINLDGEIMAILSAKSIQPDKYTVQDKKLLEILASHVSSAIARINLLEEQLQYEQRLEALHASAARLLKCNSIDDICKVTYEIIRGIFDYEWVGIGFVKDKTIRFSYATGNVQVLDSSIWYSLGDAPIEFSVNIDMDKTVITRAVKTGEVQYLPDTRLDPDYKSAGLVEGGEPVLKSEYAIPIIHSDEVVAVLNAESTKLDAFSEQDKRLLETLTNNISAVLMRLKVAEERERIQQELALEHIRVEQANELDRMKNQFISTATHELRTPVTSIIGFLELVLDYSSEELPESVRNDLNIVFRNAMRLVDMTNDLLDVQRITSGRFTITLEQVELIKTINEALEELRPLFNDKKQTLLVDTPDVLMVHVDETRISQLFINLLRNANKFTPDEGTIEVKVEPLESCVKVSVKDSGIGLSEEDIGKLFKPFPGIHHELDVSSTGLGLSIAKGIVDLHGGEIWAVSDGLGKGSTFTFTIPL